MKRNCVSATDEHGSDLIKKKPINKKAQSVFIRVHPWLKT